LQLAPRAQRHVDVALGASVDMGLPRGMGGVARNVAAALAMPDDPELRWPVLNEHAGRISCGTSPEQRGRGAMGCKSPG
jgi:hypothetical protein